jgi:hypothetical protein
MAKNDHVKSPYDYSEAMQEQALTSIACRAFQSITCSTAISRKRIRQSVAVASASPRQKS